MQQEETGVARTKRPKRRTTFGFRIGEDEKQLVNAAALSCRESVGAFIRRAALAAAKQELAK